MKKTFICILLIAAIAGIALAFGGNNAQAAERGEYLRVHIRANSNGEEDQRVKYIVRDGIKFCGNTGLPTARGRVFGRKNFLPACTKT